MADEPTETVVEDQRATDPRLETPAPVVEAAPEPVVEAEPEPVEAEEVPAAEAEAEAEETPAPEEGKKAKRTAEEVLKGRVGHLTKTLSAKDAAIAAAEARAEAAEALLAATGRAPVIDGETPPAERPAPAAPPANGRTYTQAEFDEQVRQRTVADAFNKQADAMYDAGKTKFPDWKESVELLNATGIMTPTLLEAAMATDAGAEVIHHLGNDLDEAQRVLSLPPIRMAAELAKMASKLTAPTKVPVSSAPAPIKPVGGAVNPQVDLSRVADTDDMSAYVAARSKQGSRWAQGRTRN